MGRKQKNADDINLSFFVPLYYIYICSSLINQFHHSFLHSFLPSFLPFFLSSFLPLFLSFLPFFLSSLLPFFILYSFFLYTASSALVAIGTLLILLSTFRLPLNLPVYFGGFVDVDHIGHKPEVATQENCWIEHRNHATKTCVTHSSGRLRCQHSLQLLRVGWKLRMVTNLIASISELDF